MRLTAFPVGMIWYSIGFYIGRLGSEGHSLVIKSIHIITLNSRRITGEPSLSFIETSRGAQGSFRSFAFHHAISLDCKWVLEDEEVKELRYRALSSPGSPGHSRATSGIRT